MARGRAAVTALAVIASLFGVASASGSPPHAQPPTTPRPSPSPALSGEPAAPPTPPLASPVRPPGPQFGISGAWRTTGSTSVALTFDDGPDPTNTLAMLDLLKQYDVKATFCVVGFRARDHPDVLRRIVADGHSVCCHSWQHLTDLAQRSWDYQNWDFRSSIEAIHTAVPGVPIKYFRAPGGNYTPALVALAQSYGMSSIYWDVDPRDWDHTDGYGDGHINRVIGAVQYQVRQGSIVLSHDNVQPNTVEAYRVLLPWLLARYTLIPLT